jgi:hypothetical protein
LQKERRTRVVEGEKLRRSSSHQICCFPCREIPGIYIYIYVQKPGRNGSDGDDEAEIDNKTAFDSGLGKGSTMSF